MVHFYPLTWQNTKDKEAEDFFFYSLKLSTLSCSVWFLWRFRRWIISVWSTQYDRSLSLTLSKLISFNTFKSNTAWPTNRLTMSDKKTPVNYFYDLVPRNLCLSVSKQWTDLCSKGSIHAEMKICCLFCKAAVHLWVNYSAFRHYCGWLKLKSCGSRLWNIKTNARGVSLCLFMRQVQLGRPKVRSSNWSLNPVSDDLWSGWKGNYIGDAWFNKAVVREWPFYIFLYNSVIKSELNAVIIS